MTENRKDRKRIEDLEAKVGELERLLRTVVLLRTAELTLECVRAKDEQDDSRHQRLAEALSAWTKAIAGSR